MLKSFREYILINEVEEEEKPEDKGKVREETPKDIANKIIDIKKDTVDRLESLKTASSNVRKIRIIDKQIEKIERDLNKFSKSANKAQKGYEVFPTRASKLKAMTKAKIALNNAETTAKIASNEAKRRQLLGTVGRGVQRARGAIARTKKFGQKIISKPIIQKAKEAVKRKIKMVGSEVKETGKEIKAGAERAVSKIIDNRDVKFIAKYLGLDAAKKYLDKPDPEILKKAKEKSNMEAANIAKQKALRRAGKVVEKTAKQAAARERTKSKFWDKFRPGSRPTVEKKEKGAV